MNPLIDTGQGIGFTPPDTAGTQGRDSFLGTVSDTVNAGVQTAPQVAGILIAAGAALYLLKKAGFRAVVAVGR